MKVYCIEILNWEKYQPRKDLKHQSWFRLNANLRRDITIRTLNLVERWGFICLLSAACEENKNGSVDLSPDLFCVESGLSEKNLEVLLQKLQSLQRVRVTIKDPYVDVRNPYADVQNPCSTEHNRTKQIHVRTNKSVQAQIGALRHENKPAAPTSPPPPALEKLWNENCGDLPRCLRVSKNREKHWVRRWKENPDIKTHQDVIKRMAMSRFCLGNSNGGWRASVDFFLQPDTATKVLEGKYDDTKGEPRLIHVPEDEFCYDGGKP